jgi:hypothetical protein
LDGTAANPLSGKGNHSGPERHRSSPHSGLIGLLLAHLSELSRLGESLCDVPDTYNIPAIV